MCAELTPSDLARRHARPWRIAFVLYAIALTLGTHWPQLQFGEEVPATDKTIHLLAFGGLALLLWRTRWLRARWQVGVVVLVWAILDELSQTLPGLGRYASWHDGLANLLGILIVVAWLGALGPVGREINRMRLALHAFAFDEAFARGRVWVAITTVLVVCALPVLALSSRLDPPEIGFLVRIMFLVCAFFLGAVVLQVWMRRRRIIAEEQSCFRCGTSCTAARFDAHGAGTCPACGAALHQAQWSDPDLPSIRVRTPLLIIPVGVVVLLLLLGGAAVVVTAHFYGDLLDAGPTRTIAPRVSRMIGRLPHTLTTAIDLSIILLLLAAAVFVYRSRLARIYDQSVRCRKCGHDLRGTPTHQSRGACGECGTSFARIVSS